MQRRAALLSAVTTVGLAAAALSPVSAEAAPAAPAAKRTVVAGHLVTPLTVGVRTNGTAYISQNFAGQLVKQRPGHRPRVVYRAKKGTEVGGVSVHRGEVTFTLTMPGDKMTSQHSLVMHRSKSGKVSKFADTGRWERRHNPDGDVTYGFRHLRKKCLAKVPAKVPARYQGILDTHPYGTTTHDGTTYIADAAGNDILAADAQGHLRTVGLLPAVGLKITKARAKANGMPACAVGHRYFFEPVPTDVEVAPSGDLVVSTLTGATEAKGFGGQSRVYRMDPASGAVDLVAANLAGAVGLDLARHGDYLVSQLFGNQVSRVDGGSGKVTRWHKVVMPAAVERVRGHVYVTANVLAQKPAGQLLRFGS